MKNFSRQIILFGLLLAATLAVFELTSIDLWVQDHFYDRQSDRWLVDKNGPVGRLLFYTGAKVAIAAVGAAAGLTFLAALKVGPLAAYRGGALLLCLSCIFVPLIVAGSKQFTNVYTPDQTVRYGGDKPYVTVLEKYPPGFKAKSRGKGFPAGHATGGFALMSLYFVFRRPAWKWAGLGIGLAAGWTMGLYQTFNGQHYLSHTLVTMWAAWIVILIIATSMAAIGRRRQAAAAPAASSPQVAQK